MSTSTSNMTPSNDPVKYLPKLQGNYLERVRAIAKALESDGCSCVPDFYLDACLEHDIHYRTHKTVYGDPITKEQADQLLKKRIQESSFLGRLSPMAQWRYAAVSWFGDHAWHEADHGSPLPLVITGRDKSPLDDQSASQS